MNVRDLGGLPTADGGETRFGSIVRADSVRQLSDEGWRALVDHGVRTVIDLRGDHERDEDPPAELPVEVVHVPFMEASEAEWDEIAEELDRANATSDDVAATRDAYLIFLEHFRSNVAAAFEAVARAPAGAVVIHCVGGKDRTGLLTAFLLHIAGIANGEIADDYALSEQRLLTRHQAWLDSAESDEERERLRRIAQCPADAMFGVFAELERRHGSVERYLRDIGVAEQDVERARARLRG